MHIRHLHISEKGTLKKIRGGIEGWEQKGEHWLIRKVVVWSSGWICGKGKEEWMKIKIINEYQQNSAVQ